MVIAAMKMAFIYFISLKALYRKTKALVNIELYIVRFHHYKFLSEEVSKHPSGIRQKLSTRLYPALARVTIIAVGKHILSV